LAAFESQKEEFAEMGVSLFAASVDSEEQSAEVAASGISFSLGYGVQRELGDALGAWWDERRDFIQPSEFVIRKDGRVIHSSYSSGPLARTEPGDVISMLQFLETMAAKKAAKKAAAEAES